MKILAAIMDVVFVKYWWRTKGYRISKVKKFLVYNPTKVTPCHYQKKREE